MAKQVVPTASNLPVLWDAFGAFSDAWEHDVETRHQGAVPRRGQFDDDRQGRDYRRGQPDAHDKA
jgi:hypothetical protein